MVLVLDESAIDEVLEYTDLLDVVADALVEQGLGNVERPPRPHFPVETDESRGTGLVMPAYVHGTDRFATKVVGVYEGNAARGLPTINATILLNDAETGLPEALLAGTGITNARTGCIGGLAARELATPPVRLAVFGAGPQARAQTRAIAAATTVSSVAVYSPSDSKHAFARRMNEELDVEVAASGSPSAAVEDANVVVTATTSTEPVVGADAIAAGTLVVAVGAFSPAMRELDAATVERADAVFGDVPEETAETGDLLETTLAAADVTPLADVLRGVAGRDSDGDDVVVLSVGSAVFDQAAAGHVLDRARERDLGVEIDL